MGVNDQKVIGDDKPAPKTAAETEQQQAVSDYNAAKHDGKLSMQVKVYSPFRDYFDGPTFSLSAENDTGPFDILPKHHNFISLLSPCEMILRTVEQGEQRIRISGGIMHVKADQVTVFLDV
jgi:F0F1-type ATP synthase epsilon subunit